MPKSFGSIELCKFLENHKFTARPKKASSHLIYKSPSSFKVSKDILRPFVTVVLGRKEYDPVTANCIRKQLIKLGFTKEAVEENLG